MNSKTILKLSNPFFDILSILLILYLVTLLSGCNNNAGGTNTTNTGNTSNINKQTSNNLPQKDIQKLADDFVTKYKSESGLSAISITAQCNGMNNNQPVTIFSGTFGHESQYQRPIKNDDLWSIGSNSKAFTAIVLIKLASNLQYKFSLDDHIQQWITKDKYPNLQNLLRYNPTVRQILNMTSGIADGNNRNSLLYWFNNPYTYKDPAFWISFANPESNAQPGTQWHYTDTNYQIADILVQQVTGNSLMSEINQRIITPLGLKNTVYIFDKTTDLVSRDRLVHTYTQLGNHFYNRIVDVYDWSLSNNAGAGSILANTEDMNTFYRKLFTTNEILTPQEFKEMNTLMNIDTGKYVKSPSDSKSGMAYGLGILEYNLNNVITSQGGSLAPYPNLQKNIANYNDVYFYPGATTMLFDQIYNTKTNASLMVTYNSPSGPGELTLALPILDYMDKVCHK